MLLRLHRIWTELSHACCSRITTSMDYIFILTLAINESGADI